MNSLDDLTEDQKAQVMELVIMTVKEIRDQIANDIEYTSQVWESVGKVKHSKVRKAFKVSAAIARGENEVV
jgi:hypothetical protein